MACWTRNSRRFCFTIALKCTVRYLPRHSWPRMRAGLHGNVKLESVDDLPVHLGLGALGIHLLLEGHESELAGAAVLVPHHMGARDRSVRLEDLPQLLVTADRVADPAHVEVGSVAGLSLLHSLLVEAL